MESLTLYEIQDGLRAVVDAYEDAREQLELVGNEDADVVNAAYDRLMFCESAVKEYLREEVRKVDGIAAYLRYCDQMEAAAKEERDRLADRVRLWEARGKRLKAMTLGIMQEFGVKKFETATSEIRRQANGGTVPADITEPAAIPDRFVRVTVQMTQQQLNRLPEEIRTAAKVKDREFMGAMIAGALSRGEDVPGAQLGERGEHLRVA